MRTSSKRRRTWNPSQDHCRYACEFGCCVDCPTMRSRSGYGACGPRVGPRAPDCIDRRRPISSRWYEPGLCELSRRTEILSTTRQVARNPWFCSVSSGCVSRTGESHQDMQGGSMPYHWPADTDFALWELDVLDRACPAGGRMM